MANDKIKHVTDASFEADVLKSPLPVLVDFWAVWCGPCKAIAPSLEAIADSYSGRLTIVKLDVDENPNTAMQYGVRSMPTLLTFKDGKLVGTLVGAAPRSAIERFAAQVL